MHALIAPRRPLATDLTDRQWAQIESLIPPPRRRPRLVDLREIVNAVLYRLNRNCPWRELPDDMPAWQTVNEYFRTWKNDGTLAAILASLKETGRPDKI